MYFTYSSTVIFKNLAKFHADVQTPLYNRPHLTTFPGSKFIKFLQITVARRYILVAFSLLSVVQRPFFIQRIFQVCYIARSPSSECEFPAAASQHDDAPTRSHRFFIAVFVVLLLRGSSVNLLPLNCFPILSYVKERAKISLTLIVPNSPPVPPFAAEICGQQ